MTQTKQADMRTPCPSCGMAYHKATWQISVALCADAWHNERPAPVAAWERWTCLDCEQDFDHRDSLHDHARTAGHDVREVGRD